MAILKADELDIITHSAEQTQRLGVRLGMLLKPGDVVCLSGDMGAGKTVFARGIGQGWGAKTPVTSPTFNLVHDHRRAKDKQHLYHLDCYRLNGVQDTAAIGLDDILDDNGPVIVEWPERIESVLPRKRLWVELRILENHRRNLVFQGDGKRFTELIVKLREMTFGV